MIRSQIDVEPTREEPGRRLSDVIYPTAVFSAEDPAKNEATLSRNADAATMMLAGRAFMRAGCRLTPQFSGRALPREARRERIMKWRARAVAVSWSAATAC